LIASNTYFFDDKFGFQIKKTKFNQVKANAEAFSSNL
jgi:hypothetical protein